MDDTTRKKALREQARVQMAALDDRHRAAADAAIRARLLALPELAAARTVFCYVSVGAEIDTRALIDQLLAAGKTVCVPLCLGGGVMQARRVESLNGLRPAAFGLLEPDEQAPLVAPQDIDLALVPCLCAGPNGCRLGQGGGYYDRYLAATPALRVGLCRQGQLRPALPTEAHDQPLDLVVTDTALYDNRQPKQTEVME